MRRNSRSASSASAQSNNASSKAMFSAGVDNVSSSRSMPVLSHTQVFLGKIMFNRPRLPNNLAAGLAPRASVDDSMGHVGN